MRYFVVVTGSNNFRDCIPVTILLDEDDNEYDAFEVNNLEKYSRFVAGPLPDGNWIAGFIAECHILRVM